jgi:uncharacterized membrane protein YhfC
MISITAVIFTIICSLILPLAAAIYFCVRHKCGTKSVLLGAATFTVFQILTRIPLLQLVLPKFEWYMILSFSEPILYSLFLGITAALFEEVGRLAVMNMFMTKQSDTLNAVAFGIGHGGIEAILLTGINIVVSFIAAPDTVTASPWLTAVAGIERLSAMAMHIGWSIMVMKAVSAKRGSKKLFWLLIAFASHGIIDTGTVPASTYGVSINTIEAVLVLLAAAMTVFTVHEMNIYKRQKGRITE